MAGSNRSWTAIGVAAALSITGAASLAIAQSFNPWHNQQPTLGQLGNNEAVVVDLKSFNIAKAGARGDTSGHIDKFKAREVGEGAVIFRTGDKLYIVDGKEVTKK